MTQVTESFARKVAQYIGADPDYVFRLLTQWEPFEGAQAKWNPLATTQSGEEDPSNPYYNSFGDQGQYHVRNYANEDAGAEATARTLMNGNYPALLKEIRAGNVTAASAPDIRKWGTTGFANQLEGGDVVPPGGGGQGGTDPHAGTLYGVLRDRYKKFQDAMPVDENDPAVDDYIKQWRAAKPGQPPPSRAQAYGALWQAWAVNNDALRLGMQTAYFDQAGIWQNPSTGEIIPLTQLTPEMRATIKQTNDNLFNDLQNKFAMGVYHAEADRAKAQYDSTVTRANQMMALDQANLSRASALVNRALGGMQEARGAATLVTDSLLKAAPWATSNGKTSFSANDLGAISQGFARLSGTDPNASLLNYTGTVRIDPGSLLSSYNSQYGVGGPLPNIPDLRTGPGDIPQGYVGPAIPSLIAPQRIPINYFDRQPDTQATSDAIARSIAAISGPRPGAPTGRQMTWDAGAPANVAELKSLLDQMKKPVLPGGQTWSANTSRYYGGR